MHLQELWITDHVWYYLSLPNSSPQGNLWYPCVQYRIECENEDYVFYVWIEVYSDIPRNLGPHRFNKKPKLLQLPQVEIQLSAATTRDSQRDGKVKFACCSKASGDFTV